MRTFTPEDKTRAQKDAKVDARRMQGIVEHLELIPEEKFEPACLSILKNGGEAATVVRSLTGFSVNERGVLVRGAKPSSAPEPEPDTKSKK